MDDAPTSDSIELVSMWQTNTVGMAAMIRENWQAVRPGSVALMTGIEGAA